MTTEVLTPIQRSIAAMMHDRWTVSVLLSADLIIEWISPSCFAYIGQRPQDLVGTIATDILHPDDLAAVAEMLVDTATDTIIPGLVERPSITLSVEQRMRHADGSWRVFESLVTNHLNDPAINGYFVLLRDVSHRHRLDDLLEKIGVGRPLPEILVAAASLVSHSVRPPTVVMVTQRAYLSNPQISFASPEFEHAIPEIDNALWRELDGTTAEFLTARPGDDHAWQPSPIDNSTAFLTFPIVAPTSGRIVGTASIWCHHTEGLAPYELHAITTACQLAGVAIEREYHGASLRHAATHDGLTGTHNRAGFRERLDDFGYSTTNDWAIITLDLDGFKEINDTLGHYSGDFVLVEVARRVGAVIRSHDTMARMGGDEFAILCTKVASRSEAEAIGKRIIDAVKSITYVNRTPVTIGASVGIAMGTVDDDPHKLLTNSDVAMYEAKRAGKGRCVVFDSGLTMQSPLA